ncbi:MAG TPA: 2-dehydropantoate 2-reductase [Dehalococcoidia bacterium]|nr:2-dehydropantoate 2-reductase [Dehalococcoidia bacterium]
MRVIIYGAGAIGGVVGGHLALTGTEAVLIGRPGHVNAVNQHGLRFITPTGTHDLRIPAVTAPDQIEFTPDDVVLLCVKGQNTDEALRDLHAAIADVPVFCFQNGVRNEEIAASYFPRVYGTMVRVGGVYINDGEVTARRDPPGWLIMGCYPTGTDNLVETVAERLRAAGFFVLVTPDVMPYKWGKLMGNLANSIVAITSTRDGDFDRIFRATQEEAQELLAQAGIRWVSNQQLAEEWPDSAVRPRSVLQVDAQSSTWQSLSRRQGTVETDFLNGEIVRLAERLGTRAPINEALLRIMQEMAANREPPGKYTPTELCRMVGLT